MADRKPGAADKAPEAGRPTVRLSKSGRLRIHDVTGKLGRSIAIVGIDIENQDRSSDPDPGPDGAPWLIP